jgi:5-methylcytosine-specific restriction endonuclease McrBC GTP-binding regulatory subunit McrB
LFDPPPAGEATEVTLTFDGKSQSCRLVHAAYSDTEYLSLLLRGTARQWFVKNSSVGDTLVLEPELDSEQKLTGFRLGGGAEPTDKPEEANYSGQNLLFMPVRPDWRDSKSLLGYYNPLTGGYEWTDFLRFLLRAVQSYTADDGLAWFVILDEMNLAHVEYYFADILSVMESGRSEDGWTYEPLRMNFPEDAEGDLPPRELFLPPNLYFIGTVNVDETTHAFSPKVLDRAFTIELTDVDFSTYQPNPAQEQLDLNEEESQALLEEFTYGGWFAFVDKGAVADCASRHPQVRAWLQTLNQTLKPYNLHFGFRVFDEIAAFVDWSDTNGMFDDMGGFEAAFDAAVLMKVLPKFHGSRGKLEAPLRAVLAWCSNPDAPNVKVISDALNNVEAGGMTTALAAIEFRLTATADRATRMLWALYSEGFAAFG